MSKPNSVVHQLVPEMRHLIVSLMESLGRDFTTCEYLGCDIPEGKFELHHTKYDGATFYDLMIVCSPCNKRSENVGLA